MNGPTPLIRFLRWLFAVPFVVAGAAVAFYLLLLGYSTLMRVRWISDRTRQGSKRVNRYVRAIAGTRLGMLYFNLSALHHVGRRSGRPYVTPLSAYPLGDGFVLAVAYPRVDWCENVLAAGKCTLVWNGGEYALERPEVLSRAEAVQAYPPLVRPFLIGPGTDRFIWLHRAESEPQPVQTFTPESVTASKA